MKPTVMTTVMTLKRLKGEGVGEEQPFVSSLEAKRRQMEQRLFLLVLCHCCHPLQRIALSRASSHQLLHFEGDSAESM